MLAATRQNTGRDIPVNHRAVTTDRCGRFAQLGVSKATREARNYSQKEILVAITGTEIADHAQD